MAKNNVTVRVIPPPVPSLPKHLITRPTLWKSAASRNVSPWRDCRWCVCFWFWRWSGDFLARSAGKTQWRSRLHCRLSGLRVQWGRKYSDKNYISLATIRCACAVISICVYVFTSLFVSHCAISCLIIQGDLLSNSMFFAYLLCKCARKIIQS